jgi:hypothetical protein
MTNLGVILEAACFLTLIAADILIVRILKRRINTAFTLFHSTAHRRHNEHQQDFKALDKDIRTVHAALHARADELHGVLVPGLNLLEQTTDSLKAHAAAVINAAQQKENHPRVQRVVCSVCREVVYKFERDIAGRPVCLDCIARRQAEVNGTHPH